MSIFIILLKALIIGLAIAAPVGPIGILCIRHNLNHGFKAGMAVGLGAALADGVYGAIAGLGLVAISSLLLDYSTWLKIIGGMILIYIGYKDFKKYTRNDASSSIKPINLWRLFTTTFVLTITNPLTIIMFLGVFSSLGTMGASIIEVVYIIFGVFLGSLLWWLILSLFISSTKHKLPKKFITYINKTSALILILFGSYAILNI